MARLIQILLAIAGGISVSVFTFQLLEVNVDEININIGTTPEKSTPAETPTPQTPKIQQSVPPPAPIQNNPQNQPITAIKTENDAPTRRTVATQVNCEGKSDYVCKRMAEVMAARQAAESQSKTVENHTTIHIQNDKVNVTDTTEMTSKAVITNSEVESEGFDENGEYYHYETETTVESVE